MKKLLCIMLCTLFISPAVNAYMAHYIDIYLTGLVENITDNIISSIFDGIGDFEEGSSGAELQENSSDFAASYLEGKIQVDYEGIVGVSENQKIEIISANEHKSVFSITDLQEIVTFLQEQKVSEWEYVGSIPATADKICEIIRYANARKTTEKKLVEQYRDILYKTSDGYYIEEVIADNGFNMALCFKVPDSFGDDLNDLCR